MTNDISVNLRAIGKKDKNIYRILPKTLADNVTESDGKMFVSQEEKDRWNSMAEVSETVSIEDDEINRAFQDA